MLPTAITPIDMLTAGSDGFLAPYDGAQTPCEMPDCPYVAFIIAGDFMALCCYDCALYHAHPCSRTPFPLGISAPGGAVSTGVGAPDECEDDEDDAVAAAVAASMASDAPPDSQPPNPSELLTAAQLAGIARQPDQSASNAEVCDVAAAIAASLADLQTDDPGLVEQHAHDSFTIRMTQTQTWTTAIVAASAEEARQMAERTTRGWQAENDTVVVEPATETNTNAETYSDVEDSMPARPPRHTLVATPALTAPLGASSSATMAAPAIWDGSSETSVPGSTSIHIAHLRTLPNARVEQSDLAAADVASRTSLTHTDWSDALHLHRTSSDAVLLATSADVAVKIYGFIAQATDSLQHLQQRYDDQCTPGNAAALDVARTALTHGLAALRDVLPLSVLLPYGDQYGTPYFTHRDLLLDDPTALRALSRRTNATRRTGPSPVLLLFALVASTIFIAQLFASATTHTAQPSASAPRGSAATVPAGPTILPEGSGIPIHPG